MKKILEFIKNKKVTNKIIAVCIFIISFIIYYCNFTLYKNNNSNIDLNIVKICYTILALIVFSVIISLLIYYEKKKEKKEISKIFFITALTIGSVYLFLSPLLTGSDENIHYFRIYEIANGNLLTPMISENKMGSEMPISIDKISKEEAKYIKYNDSLDMMKIPLNKDKTKVYENRYPSAAIYSPIQYLPQVIGMKIGIILNLSPYAIGMLGRIFGFIAWLIITSYAIKIIPSKKVFVMTILLLPSSIAFATCLSGDVLTNATIILFIAYIYKIIWNKEKVTKKEFAIMLLLAIIISLCKIVYAPLILLFLLIPNKSFNSKKEKYIYFILLGIITAFFSIGWLAITKNYFSVYTKTDLQKAWILSNPIKYIFVILRTYFTEFIRISEDFVGGNMLYQSQFQILPIVSVAFWVLVVAAIKVEENLYKFNSIQKTLVALIGLAIIVLISTALYIQCTANNIGIGVGQIAGIQGRYLIPVAFLSIFLINKKYTIIKQADIISYLIILQIPIFITMIYTFII
ncbi:MAG: DUF2142 domain-containing protein [Clostridia bacterium]